MFAVDLRSHAEGRVGQRHRGDHAQRGNPGFGKYVIVWRRQTDGRWLMHLDMWNSSPAPTASP